ncbi:hypothetical protein M427DRAFT_39969 [Gonapodya prolifera JEL478]|uniref:Uncharacterized protein n=1 Tax=Gonapodya prolifera (strain JEL478) TaxID=1344416 RepID=A0A138ZWC1_GONPJ|nr:hypothetical protein M427DRAFT_39969 [Gonapodya prolifera JEL478]|eukprot:KXS08787.1 hypothetical protein M427DRAFT_39969 [Gonapodya prolifera JEL478]
MSSAGQPSASEDYGWVSAKRFVTSKRETSWVFHDGHFKKQEKGNQKQAVCLQHTIKDAEVQKKLDSRSSSGGQQLTIKETASRKQKVDLFEACDDAYF